jgi:hypothetical protein
MCLRRFPDLSGQGSENNSRDELMNEDKPQHSTAGSSEEGPAQMDINHTTQSDAHDEHSREKSPRTDNLPEAGPSRKRGLDSMLNMEEALSEAVQKKQARN